MRSHHLYSRFTSHIPLARLSDNNTKIIFDTDKWSPQGGRSWHFDLTLGPQHICVGNVRRSDCGPVKVEGLMAELDAPDEFFFRPNEQG